MKEQIEAALSVLLNLQLRAKNTFAVADWDAFEFGSRLIVVDRKGKWCEIGEYALIVECAWRITGPEGIIVASRDRYDSPEGDEPPDFEWNTHKNRCMERSEQFFNAHQDPPLIVEAIHADSVGSVYLSLRGSYRLDIFPDDSFKHEHWRLVSYTPDGKKQYFIVSGDGIRI